MTASKSVERFVVMRVTSEEALDKRHNHIVADVLRTINRQIVDLFFQSCIREKDATKEQDALRSILCTPEMKEVMLGRCCDLKWILKAWGILLAICLSSARTLLIKSGS